MGGAQNCFKHLGMYAYKADFLKEFMNLPIGYLEGFEKLEQLRALENGKRISVEIVAHGTHGVDVPEDLASLSFS